MIKKLSISILIVLFAFTYANGAAEWFAARSYTGGGAGALDALDGDDLADEDKAIVVRQSGETAFYNLDADSSLSEDGTNYSVISPDSNAGTKRWIKVWSGGRTIIPDSSIDQGDNAVVGSLAWHITNTSSNPTTITVLPGTYTVTTNTTIPETITLKVVHGGILSLTGTLTINGPIEAGSYRIFDGTMSNLSILGMQEVNATWGFGVPDGSSDQTTDGDGFIAACAAGTEIFFPTFANEWVFNVSIQQTGLTLKGQSFHKTPVLPNGDAAPVFDIEAAQVAVKGFHINGNGAGTTVYGIRVDRDATSPASRFVIKDCRIQNVTNGIYVKNNYYGIIDNNKIEDVTYGIFMRNAANDNRITNTKFDDFDYGIAILNVSGIDTNKSHSNTIDHCTFESSNTDGIGVQMWNVPDNRVINSYFEGNTWSVIEAGGPIRVVHNGGDNKAYLTDSKGRDFVKMGVLVGDTVYNRTNGESGTVSAIGNDAATNDKLSITLSGGEDFDDDDYCVVDLHNTTNTRLRNHYANNHFNVIGELQTFFDGVSQTSSVHGEWASRKDGKYSYTHTNVSGSPALAANTEAEIDFSSNYSSYTDRPMGKVLISFRAVNDQDSAGYCLFKPAGGDDDDDQYLRIHINKSSEGEETSAQLEVPINSDFKTTLECNRNLSTYQIRLHAFWN